MPSQPNPDRKCYAQFCPMATALDIIGDRWTILIIRELLGGAARFHDLQEGLSGVPKNLLTSRLRRLEGDGIVRRIRSQNTMLYALTDMGAAARTAVEELGFWGALITPVEPPRHPRSIRAIAMALQAVLSRAGDALPTTRHIIELEVDGEHIQVTLDARPSVMAGSSTDADARMRVSRPTMSDFLLGRSFDKSGFVLVSGNRASRTALIRALGTMNVLALR